MSQRSASALCPWSVSSLAAEIADFSFQSANTTEAPDSAKAFAVAKPSPEPAPVTSATVFSKEMFIAVPHHSAVDPLEIRHAFQCFRIPGAHDCNLCGSVIELAKLLRCQFQGSRSDVLLQPLHFRGAGDWNDPWLLCQQPCQRNLGSCRIPLRCKRRHHIRS